MLHGEWMLRYFGVQKIRSLYDLELTVSDANRKTCRKVHSARKSGFRRFEMKDGIMTLNGKRIVFKGVNRHEFSSVSGRHVSEEELRKDLDNDETKQYQCHPYLPLSG